MRTRPAPRAMRYARVFSMMIGAQLVLNSCAAVGGAGYSGGGGGGFRDDRRLIGGFADVRGVGVSRRYVFAATSSGISVYDRLFNTWLPPLARGEGLEDGQITFMAGDPTEDAVWVGVPGAVIVYRPQGEQVQRTPMIGVPEGIVFERTPGGDAYIRAAGQWTRMSRVGMSSQVTQLPSADKLMVPANLNDVYARYPGLRNGSPLLLRSQQSNRALRSYPVTSGAMATDQPSEVWLGTSGDGLYKVDAVMQQATPVRYGLLERGVGALALAADGVWVAGLGLSQLRAGLSFATNDLQRWRWIDGTIAVPMLGVRAMSLSLWGSRAWIGTDRGVLRVQLDGTEEMASWNILDGLPDERAYAVAARADGVWVGTARGLVFITDTSERRNVRTRGIGVRLLDNTPVYALQPVGDTLWIGTDAGLLALPPSGALSRPVGNDPALRRRINAIAWSDTVLIAATDDAVLQLAPKGGAEPARLAAVDVRQVGQVTRVAIDARSIVVAGTDGVLVLSRAIAAVGGAPRLLRAPSDIPGPVLDLALGRDWLWLGTPVGLMRLRRSNDGGLP